MKNSLNILIVLMVIFFSCRKEGCSDDYAVNYDVKAKKGNDNFCVYKKPEVKEYVPVYGANTATLVAIDEGKQSLHDKWGSYTLWDYTLGASFSNNGKDLVDAGIVSMSIYPAQLSNQNIGFLSLNKNSNNSYIKNYYANSRMALTYFPNPLEWRSTGDIWPAFNLFNSRGFSGQFAILSESPIVSSSYTFTVSPITNADSLVLDIIGQRNHITKVIPATAASHIFSQEEIESVGKGDAVLRVVSVRYDIQTVGPETYYLLNEKISTKEVFITKQP
jgi:hypothetical protein